MACSTRCKRPSPSQAHCGACHLTFGGVRGFDEHRTGGSCLDPAGLGMTLVGGVWRRCEPDRPAPWMDPI